MMFQIHLGQNVWLPKQSYDDAVYNAATNSMFVKNIAMAVFGSQYLKEHSVKGKGYNKTKSKPRPAIDPTKALAVRGNIINIIYVIVILVYFLSLSINILFYCKKLPSLKINFFND